MRYISHSVARSLKAKCETDAIPPWNNQDLHFPGRLRLWPNFLVFDTLLINVVMDTNTWIRMEFGNQPRKTILFQTTKMAVMSQFQFRCEGDHEYCPLEGHVRGFGRRTRYMENYRPALAARLLLSWLRKSRPSIILQAPWIKNQKRKQTSGIIKLMESVSISAIIDRILSSVMGSTSMKSF